MDDFVDVMAVFTDAGGNILNQQNLAAAWMSWDFSSLQFLDYGYQRFEYDENQRMVRLEYLAIVDAVTANEARCNRLVVFTEMLAMVKWVDRVRNGNNNPCLNEEFSAIARFLAASKAEFHYVPAHSNIAFNCAVDKLCAALVNNKYPNVENLGQRVLDSKMITWLMDGFYTRYFVTQCMNDPDEIPVNFSRTFEDMKPVLQDYSQAWDKCYRDAAMVRRERKALAVA